VFADAPCSAYFEGIACEIKPTQHKGTDHELVRQAAMYFERRCAEVHQHGRLELLAETVTSPRTTEGFFDEKAPHVRLYRWLK
jgi:hypothetical protein